MKLKHLLTPLLLGTALLSTPSWAYYDLIGFQATSVEIAAPTSSYDELNIDGYQGTYKSQYGRLGIKYNASMSGIPIPLIGFGIEAGGNLAFGYLGKKPEFLKKHEVRVLGTEAFAGITAELALPLNKNIGFHVRGSANIGALLAIDHIYTTYTYKVSALVRVNPIVFEMGMTSSVLKNHNYLDTYHRSRNGGNVNFESFYVAIGYTYE